MVAAGVAAPHPAGHAEERQAKGTALDETPSRGVLLFVEQLPIVVERFGRRWRQAGPRLLAPLGGRHPTRDEHDRFRGAHRTLLRVVNLFAVETEACVPELHTFSVTVIGRAARDVSPGARVDIAAAFPALDGGSNKGWRASRPRR